MCDSMKEVYSRPEMASVSIAPQGSLLQVISNPGGTVPGLDPDEG